MRPPPSEFTHEREGLAFLAKSVPDQSRYLVLNNFTFQVLPSGATGSS